MHRLSALALLLVALAAPAAAARELLVEVEPHGGDIVPTPPPTCPIQRTETDVIVVGGGISGLTTARNLLRAGHKVVVLEARKTLGGRSERQWVTTAGGQPVPCNLPQCKATGDKWWWDLGGQWVGPTHARFLAMAKEYNVVTYPAPQAQGMHRIYIAGAPIDVPDTVLDGTPLTAAQKSKMTKAQAAAITEYQRVSDALWVHVTAVAKTIAEPWKVPNAAALDSETFQSWLEKTTTNKDARALLIWTFPWAELGGVSPGAVSVLEMARVLATMTEGKSEDMLFYGAAGQFVQKLSEEITRLGGTIVTSSPARHVHQNQTSVTVYSDGAAYVGRYTVLAMPPWLTGRITYTPALTARRNQLTQRAPMGTTVKMIAFYDTPFWRKTNVPTALIGMAINPAAQVTEVFDVSPPNGPGVLAGFLFTDAALTLAEKGSAALQAAALKQWATYMGDARIATNALNFVYTDWPDEQWTGGAYNGGVAPGFWTSYGPAFYAPQGRIHYAGTESATRWMGFYEGAILTGEAAATKVSNLLKTGKSG